MGRRGRFGKYGEMKRVQRLRRSRRTPPLGQKSGIKPRGQGHRHGSKVDREVQIRTRLARPEDMAFINRLSEDVFHIYGPYEDIVYSWLESETTVTIMALMDGKPVGFAMIGQLIHETELPAASELLAIAVESEKQGLGIGEILLKKLEAEAAGRQVKTLLLHTAEENLPAKKLFIRNGYQAIGLKRRFYPAGQDALLMCKQISGKGGS